MDAKPRLTSGIEGEEMFPKPVRDLMIFVQEAVSKIDSGNTDSVTVRVKQRFRKLLSDSGFRPEKIDEALEQSEPTPLAQLGVEGVQKMILKGYQECLKSSGPQEKDPILVVSRTLKEDSDVRIALQALRRSPGYTALRDKKIWALSGAELKEHLQVADCSDGFMISRMNHRFSHVIQSSLHFSNV